MKKIDAKLLREKKPLVAEVYNPAFDRHELQTRFPIFNDAGEITHIGGMFLDIDDRIKARQSAEQSQRILQSFFDHAPIALSLADMDGTMRMANRATAEHFDIDPKQLVDRTYSEMMAHWPGSTTSADGLIQRVAAGRTLNFTAKFDAPNGDGQREMDMTFFPIRDVAGNVVEIGTFAIDVTEQRQAQAGLAEQQANLKAFFDYAPLQVYVTDLDHKIVMVNDWVYRETGAEVFRPENVIGLSADQMVPKNWADMSHDNDETVVEKGGVTQVEMRGQFGGKERDIASIRFPIKDADGKVIRIGGFVVDVSAQMEARREAEAAQTMLQAFFEHIPAMTFIISRDRKYLSVNNYAATTGGMEFLSPDNLIGKPDITNTPEAWHAVIAEAHRTVIEEGRMVTHHPSIDLPNGSFDLSVSRFPIRNEQGEVAFVGGLLFDQTAEKAAAKQVAAAQESLHQSEKLAALGQLLAGVAHELNNPLAIVMGRAAMLKDKLAGTPHEDSIQRLRSAAERCARIVKTFITMARQTGPQRTLVQIPDLIEAALDMTGHGLRSAGISLSQDIASDLPDLTADGDQLIQVLINLIINSQHALEGKSDDPKLHIAAHYDAVTRQLVVDVADNGQGVLPENAVRIFEPFFTTKDVGSGTGLGLSVCRSMIEAHDGTLTLADTPGGGATFRISLPLGEAVDEIINSATETAKIERRRALIVDDEEEVAEILADLLAELGLDCTIVTSGQAALDRLAAQPFDAIFSDVRMPRMDGPAFLAALETAHPAMVDRLVFATGDVLHRQVEGLRAAGRPIVEKPYDPQLVRDAVTALFAQGDEA